MATGCLRVVALPSVGSLSLPGCLPKAGLHKATIVRGVASRFPARVRLRLIIKRLACRAIAERLLALLHLGVLLARGLVNRTPSVPWIPRQEDLKGPFLDISLHQLPMHTLTQMHFHIERLAASVNKLETILFNGVFNDAQERNTDSNLCSRVRVARLRGS